MREAESQREVSERVRGEAENRVRQRELELRLESLRWVREWGVRQSKAWVMNWDERVIKLGLGLVFRDQNDIVFRGKVKKPQSGINRFDCWFFRFSGWTRRFLLFTSFLVIFFIITGPDLRPVPGWTGRTDRSGPVFNTMNKQSGLAAWPHDFTESRV